MRLTKLAMAAAAALIGAAASAQETTILKVHHFLPATSNAQQRLIQPWCDKVQQDSGDRLKCEIYPAMQLGGTPAQLFDQARDGAVDIVWTVLTYQSGRFTKSEVFELPFMTTSAKEGSRALYTYVQENAMDEFRGVQPLLLHVHDGAVFHFASKPVEKLEDLKGLKIRAANRMNTVMLTALGAAPVQMPLPQVPESLTKGVIDGAMVPWEGVPAVKLQEIADFSLDTPAGKPKFSNSIFALAMNKAKYDALPADLREVIDRNSGAEGSALAGENAFDAVVEAHKQLALDQGGKIAVMPEDEYERWKAASQSVYDSWFEEVAAKGGDGKALLEKAQQLLAEQPQ